MPDDALMLVDTAYVAKLERERDELREALKEVRMALKNGGDMSVRRIELMIAVIDEALEGCNA